MTTKLVNDIEAVSKRFVTRIGNAKGAAQDFSIIIHAIVNSRDTDILTKEGGILTQLRAKGEQQALRSIAVICEALYPNTEVKYLAKEKRYNWKIAGVGQPGVPGDTAALNRFDDAIRAGLTLRSTLASKTRGDKPEVSDADAAAAFVAEHGVKKAQERLAKMQAKVDAMVAAIQKANASA